MVLLLLLLFCCCFDDDVGGGGGVGGGCGGGALLLLSLLLWILLVVLVDGVGVAVAVVGFVILLLLSFLLLSFLSFVCSVSVYCNLVPGSSKDIQIFIMRHALQDVFIVVVFDSASCLGLKSCHPLTLRPVLGLKL